MLKQSPNRIQRSKGFKVKHVVQICVLLAIVFWLINQLKHSYYNKKEYDDSKGKTLVNSQSVHEIVQLGRKGLHPRIEGTSLDNENLDGKGELEEDVEEIKSEEIDDGGGGGDDEIDGHNQDQAEEEAAEEVEDLIDVDDREREEGGEEQESEEKSNQLEAENSLDDPSDKRHLGSDDASGSRKQKIQTIDDEFETGTLRRVKEKEVENAGDAELTPERKSRGIKEFTVDTIAPGHEVGNQLTMKILNKKVRSSIGPLFTRAWTLVGRV